MNKQTFTLEGSDGEPHEYTVTCHGGKEGMKLMLTFAAMASEPLLEAVRFFARQQESGSLGDVEIEDILDNIDLERVGKSLRTSLLELDPDLLHELFAKTTRDGDPLSKDYVFDEAYAGNWSEWRAALFEIVKLNGFLDFLPTTPRG
jgi:hypothetical protein